MRQLVTYLGLMIVGVAMAEPLQQNLLQCQSDQFLKTQCQFPTIELAPKHCTQFSGEAVCAQMTLTMQYRFTCSGHALPIGVKSESAQAGFTPGPGLRTVVVNGVGSFYLANFNPVVTSQASVSLDCTFFVDNFSLDLSTATKMLVDERLSQMREGNGWLESAKSIESRSNTLQAILQQIDIPAIKTLLGNVRSKVILLRDAYDDAEAKERLNQLVTSMDSLMAQAPGPEQAAVWRSSINGQLQSLVESTGSITTRLAERQAELYVRGEQLLAFAAVVTANHYAPLFEVEHQRAMQFVE